MNAHLIVVAVLFAVVATAQTIAGLESSATEDILSKLGGASSAALMASQIPALPSVALANATGPSLKVEVHTSARVTTSAVPLPPLTGVVVTKAHYDQILPGMSYKQVVRIIGFAGEERSRSENRILFSKITTVMYSWTNSNNSNMIAMFQKDRLINKAQAKLPTN